MSIWHEDGYKTHFTLPNWIPKAIISTFCSLLDNITSFVGTGGFALLWWNAKCKCKFANKHTQANKHNSKWQSQDLNYVLHFVKVKQQTRDVGNLRFEVSLCKIEIFLLLLKIVMNFRRWDVLVLKQFLQIL